MSSMFQLSTVVKTAYDDQGKANPYKFSDILASGAALGTGTYPSPGYPSPLNGTAAKSAMFMGTISQVVPVGWRTRILRKISLLNINVSDGNFWKVFDYAALLAKYPAGTYFYMVYKGKLFRVRFNAAETGRIKNTTFWYSPDRGTTWQSAVGLLDTSPDGQTINGVFVSWDQPYIYVCEVAP